MDSSRFMAMSISITREGLEWQTWSNGGLLHKSILCMQGGDDDASYAKNCEAPASAISLSKPLLKKAIQSMKTFKGEQLLSIADLGCATGYNTLATVDLVVESLREQYIEEESCFEPEFQVYFSDLPSNDFNSLFRSLPPITDSMKRPYCAAGVAGSFYNRLFPKGKLHVVVSLSSLHWLSQIPETVLDNKSPAWNKGRAWIDGAKQEIIEAYSKQSKQDLLNFLECRKEEMVVGGILFTLMAGRSGSEPPENQLGDPDSRAKHPFTSSMDQAWDDLLNEGLIDQTTRDTFNIPAYMRSTDEVENAFKQCGGFEIHRLEYQTIAEHSKEIQQKWIRDPISYGRAKTNLVRATLMPMVKAHLGSELCEELFKRFEKRASEDMEMIHKTCFYGVIVVCAFRK